ncbi:DUF5677 domain-containing protein [Oceanobacillus sp. CAU 1775]
MKQIIIDTSFEIMKIVGRECFKEKELDVEDAVILALMHSIISNCNDINFLLKNNRHDSIEIISRTFLEKSVSLQYILKEETERRSNAYFYSFKMQSAKKLKESLDNMKNSKDKEEILEYTNSSSEMKKEVPGINSFDEYIEYYEEIYKRQFNSGVNSKKRRNWYNLNGDIQGMRDLMRYVGKEEIEYYFFYGMESLHTHGLSSMGNLSMKDNILLFRSNLNIELLDNKLTNYVIENIVSIIKHYKLEKNKEIKNKLALIEINFNIQYRK